MADITSIVSAFTSWFNGIIGVFRTFTVRFGSVSISFYALILTGVIVSILLSVFWKGAKK